jgi:glutathionylspermidine synthase
MSVAAEARIEVRALAGRDPLSDPARLRALRERYLVWDPFFAGARRVDLHPLVLPRDAHRAAIEAAEGAFAAVAEAGSRALEDAAERARYGLSEGVNRLARSAWGAGDRETFARVDLLLDSEGRFRACEVNSDCPGGQNEAHGLPRLAQEAGFRGAENPTTVVEAMAGRLAELAGPGGTIAMLHATAFADDLQVCALVRRALEPLGVRAHLAPPTAPKLDGQGRLTLRGEPLAALYRYFPAELMEGQDNLDDLCAALASRAIRTFPSPAGIYSQSKVAFSRACALRDSLSPRAREAVSSYLPETLDLLDAPESDLVRDRAGWVVKRALGRVGDRVFVGALQTDDAWRHVLGEVFAARGRGEAWIAQRFVPQRPIPTPFGDRFLTLGVYLVGGRFVGYFARVTPETHVSHDALCVPVFTAVA